jgi:hydroxymethylglutaryl-CoA lyase
MSMLLDNSVSIVEVGPRDGLQNLSGFVKTPDKIGLIRRLAESGVREIQAGAFVSSKAIPQFRDMHAVMDGLGDLKNVKLTALVPNIQGARAAIAAGIRKLNFFFSVSRSHNLNNVRQTPEESLASLQSIREEVLSERDVAVRVDLAVVFGCPFEGAIKAEVLLDYLDRVASLGFREVTLCDTVGFAHPALVESVIGACRKHFPEMIFGVHLHDTRGLALANALRAYDMGIRSFDAALGGLGGCPFAPGASGNVATEDMVFMFEAMGLSTGIDLPALLRASQYLQEILPDTPLTSALSRSGPPCRVEFAEPCRDRALSGVSTTKTENAFTS